MTYSDTRWKVTCETFNSTILFVYFIFSLVHLLLVALSLCCCAWVSSNWGVWGCCLAAVNGLLAVLASPAGERGLSTLRLQ